MRWEGCGWLDGSSQRGRDFGTPDLKCGMHIGDIFRDINYYLCLSCIVESPDFFHGSGSAKWIFSQPELLIYV